MASLKKALVIVESPAKAKKIAGFLGDDYIVRASMGHIRDLPSSAAEIPPAVKKEPWSTLGVNVENDFDPLYVVPAEKKKLVTELKDCLKKVKHIGWGPPHWGLDARIRGYKWVDDAFELFGRIFFPRQASSLYVLAVKPE